MGNLKKNGVGLAMAGGGPAGAIYEIGTIRALEELVEGLDLNEVDAYVGVSAGAFIIANLANQVTTAQMCRAVVSSDPDGHPFVPETFLTPAFGEFIKAGTRIPRTLFDGLVDFVNNGEDRNLIRSLMRLSRTIPVGLFDNEPIRRYLHKIYNRPGRTDDFRKLGRDLFVVAADLDSGKPVIFGKDRTDVPISTAVQASSALPGLYPPVLIDGRYYVDGVLLKTLHASTILDAGVKLAFCINPIVPVDTKTAVEAGFMKRGKLIDRGMPGVLSQTFRTLIHSRMVTGFAVYEGRYSDTDVVLIEPSKEDYRMFFTNIFSFSSRKSVCEHAYRSTYKHMSQRREQLEPLLARHGLRLRTELLDGPMPDLWSNVNLPAATNRRKRPRKAMEDLEFTLARIETLVNKRLKQEQQEQQARQVSSG